MPLTPETRLGTFEITGSLGVGGMGEVYRARDTTLGRDVALKILPEFFATDPDRLMRFEREAKTLAALNHPHIAQIYGIEQTGGVRALVMELVDGEDLSQRLARGPVPLDEALPIAKQIAEALEAAHEQGIIHRDLKPANIKVRADGTVKVLDFGLAKGMESPGGDGGRPGAAIEHSPTFTSPALTRMGVILGTAAYMAPEQARGRAVDRRADVWAFGCVLYEMLTGRTLFGRAEVSDTLAAVLTHEWDPGALPAPTPPAVRRVLARCLQRDARRRLDSMRAVHLELEDAAGDAGREAGRSRLGHWTMAALATGIVLTGGVAGLVVGRSAPPTSFEEPVVAQIGAPADVIYAFHHGFALSPDGRMLAFTARDAAGLRQLWVRPLGALDARPLPNTDNAHHPFWSPDGAHIGYFAGDHLRRIAIAGGQPLVVSPAAGSFATGTWSERGEILFGLVQGTEARIFRVPADGGSAEAVKLTPAGLNPYWLPGGERFLFAGGTPTEAGVYAGSRAGGAGVKVLSLSGAGVLEDPRAFAYSPDGYLFVNRSDALTVQRFDARAEAVVGRAVPLAGPAGTPSAWFAVSAAGDALVASARSSSNERGSPGDPIARLRWFSRDGHPAGDMAGPGRFWTVRLSPDGRRAIANPELRLWVYEGGARRPRRLPSGSDRGGAFHAVWSPDGSEVVYTSARGDIFRVAVEREGSDTALAGLSGIVSDWSRDGARLLVRSDRARGTRGSDILLYDFTTGTVSTWLATPSNESHARFSPDGRWIAYVSDVTGRTEVFLRPLAGEAGAVPVSSGGGVHPTWRADGGELFYLGPGDEIMAVTIEASAGGIRPGEPRRLFRVPVNDVGREVFSPYDVAPDGQRFLLNVAETPEPLLYIRGLRRMLEGR
ncbi:MAG TPA: protein kinase [Vicinamibacterales bacterium]|nr:protein kinase [Vicinamibacterales bacterium]